MLQQIRQKLFGVSYQMLGSASQAEDIAQETIAAFLTHPSPENILHPEAFLVRSAINRCLNFLKSEARRQYMGEYLPEPILDEAIRMQSRLDISYGFALMLRRLNPQERAIFLMRNSFDLPFSELAVHFDVQEAHARKLFQRAKAKLQEARSNLNLLSVEDQTQLVNHFLQAAASGKMDELIQLLKHDMILWSDGGGKKAAATNALRGRDICLKFIFGLAEKAAKAGDKFYFDLQHVDGEMFILYYSNGELDSIIYAEMSDQQIEALYIQRNPDKLKFVVTK